MEDSIKKIELIDQFIENERKSRQWTVLNVTIFCLLGFVVFLLAYQLNKSNAKFREQNIELQKTKTRLDSALVRLSEKNESLQEDSFSLSKRAGNYDSLKNAFDTLALIFSSTQSQHTAGGWSNAGQNLDNISKEIYKDEKVVLSDTLKKSILIPHVPKSGERPVYIVYMQCMPGYEKISASITKQLKDKRYRVPGLETIEKITFDPQVKYFHDEDANEAKKIMTLINGSDPYFKDHPAKIQKVNIKSPSHQLEVWIGQYKKRDINQLIRQSANYGKAKER